MDPALPDQGTLAAHLLDLLDRGAPDTDPAVRRAAVSEVVDVLLALGWTPPPPDPDRATARAAAADDRLVDELMDQLGLSVSSRAEDVAASRARSVRTLDQAVRAYVRAGLLTHEADGLRRDALQTRTRHAGRHGELSPEAWPVIWPASLRRALTLLHREAQRPITIEKVARRVGVGPRALQLSFAHHLSLTPVRYLQALRLDGAHEDLLAADPDSVTVREVAERWQFSNAGRFAGQYRRRFGESPSVTLRTWVEPLEA